MSAENEPRPHDELIEPVYAGLRSERTDPDPAGEPEPAPPPLPRPLAPWPTQPPEPREPGGVGGLCGLVILLVALIVIGSLAVMLFGPEPGS